MKNKIFSVLFFTFISICGFAQSTTSTPASSDSTKPYVLTQTMPEFPGTFNKYLKDSIRYPLAEKKAGKEGMVKISFVIEKDGTVTNVHAVKEVEGAPGFTEEAIRVIKTMPKWKPATLNGHPARMEMTQPITFYLPGDRKSNKRRK